ncbi:MAG: SWIM zinc finger family protein [Bacilli bacterium]|nr:SWIM zinc finger family protein [Bacilli bacterium]
MSIISSASSSSSWRGLDYYKKNKIKNLKKLNDFEYTSEVIGSETYSVYLDVSHPRRSTCNCPHANGKRIICKHIVATFFEVFPQEAINFEKEQERLQEEYEDYQAKLYNKTQSYIKSLTKKELIDELSYILDYAPDWVYNDFVRRNDIE